MKRTSTNHDIVTRQLYKSVKCVQRNHWKEGLSFLSNHKIEPATFRQTLITLIRQDTRLEEAILQAYMDVITCCTKARGDIDYCRGRRQSDYDPTPIWILPFIFERLICAPNPDKSDTAESINTLITRRLRMFRSGQIEALYKESNQVVSRTPKDNKQNPAKIQRSAQIAADCDNYRSANIRLTNDMPVAAIDDEKLEVLQDLHPESYNLNLHHKQHKTRGSTKNRKRLTISPTALLETFSHLKRGKGSGFELDSLDIFIKLASKYRRAKKKSSTTYVNLETLAIFFTTLANGDVTPKIKSILRTTYLVALHKDPTNDLKLRPLGIPSAIRRIMAIAVLQMYRGRFAEHLLPFNYAFGVHGGVDFITTTLRLGIEEYMTKPEARNGLPTRSLVSLDIKNMFNAISREKARQIISRDFPELDGFADCLYEDFGRQCLRREDGSWEVIEVQEGFSQGCPASPIFAALVLTSILTKINRDLSLDALTRFNNGNKHDDGQGGKPIILGYVDDVNVLLPIEDVEKFFLLFRLYGSGIDQQGNRVSPGLGAVLNTEKTRIMTTTTNKSVRDRLLYSFSSTNRTTGASLKRAIDSFSTDKGKPFEETEGLRVLGVPIGSPAFCNRFILKMVQKAVIASDKVIAGLDSSQTILQIFRMCTAHKLTHLFAADIINADITDLPVNWNLWDSDMATEFTAMIDKVISSITNRPFIPNHALLISSMSPKAGGLGIQHPRSAAIPTFMLNTRRCLQYVTEGVWIGPTDPLITLPTTITNLYTDWRSSSSHTFQIFAKYLDETVDICVSEQVENKVEFFLTKSSINTCRERIRMAAASRTKIILEFELKDDKASLDQLEDLLEPKMSAALLDMGRLNPTHRRKNEDFTTMLKRKLRLELWPECLSPICACGIKMDLFGDHCLSCRKHCKTSMHNSIRNGLEKLFQDLFQLVNLTSSPKNVIRERPGVISATPKTRPFDLSVLFDHILDERAWRTDLLELGFDVTIISSKPSHSTTTKAARLNEIKLRLRDGEKKKFTRCGKTDKDTGITLTGDQIIKRIIHNRNRRMALLPIAISPHGHIGNLTERFLYGTDPDPLPTFAPTRRYAKEAAELAISPTVPRGLLLRANTIWREKHPEIPYSGSYKAMDPRVHFDQKLGLLISTAISSHLLRAHFKNDSSPHICPGAKKCVCCEFTPEELFAADPLANPIEEHVNPTPVDSPQCPLSPSLV